MPPRAAIEQLPENLRMELAVGLKADGWARIDEWTKWLEEQGYTISRSAVGRFNQKARKRFENAMADAEQTAALARIMVANQSDDGGAVLRANELLAADGLLRTFTALRELEEEVSDMMDAEDEEKADAAKGLTLKLAETHAKLVRASSELTKAGVQRDKWAREIRAQERIKAIEEAAKAAGEAGASGATIERIREILETGG